MLAMLALVLVSAAAVLAAALYLHLERRYSTWRRKGVPGPQASVSLKIPKILRGLEHMGDVADRVYKQFRDAPIAGTYVLGNPVLHIHDPDILKQVLIKEFQDFSGRGAKSNPDYDPLSNHLFLQSGPMWRNLRVKLAPTFTSGKIKYMFQTILRSSEQLADYLDERIAANGGSYCEDARPLMMRLFVDTISLVILGIDSNVVRNPASEIYAAARRAVAPSLSNSWRSLIALYASETMRTLRIRATDADTMAFFTNLVRDTVNYREQHGVDRADMLNLLMQLKNQGFVTPDKLDAEGSAANGANGNAANGANGAGDASNKQRLTLDEIAAQVFVFTIAGFESSAGTTSFTLYEMARNPAILEKALLEVDQIMADFDGKITYEAIMSMPYLEKCVSETLRKYPPLAVITREAGTTRKVPLTNVEVAKGTRVVVPIRALHYDPQYWPDPDRYDPERFSEEQKASRPALAYLPFGDGPRICPAGRLGMVQIKTALLKLLSKYTVSIASQSPQKVSINPRSFATTPDIPLNITFKPRKLTSSS